MKEANTEVKTKESPTTANLETRINKPTDLVASVRILNFGLTEFPSREGRDFSGARTKALLLGTEGHLLPPDYPAKEAHCPFVY